MLWFREHAGFRPRKLPAETESALAWAVQGAIKWLAAEDSAREALLDSERVNGHLGRVVRLRAERRMLEGGIRRRRARRLAAVQAKITAEAAEIRKRAQEAPRRL